MKSKKKINILYAVVGVLVLSLGYAFYGIYSYQKQEEAEKRQRVMDSITYLTKADVAKLLAKSPETADYIMEVYVGDGGANSWHTQKLFLLRYKPVYTYLNDNNVAFKVYYGDTISAEEKNKPDLAKDLQDIANATAKAPLEYRLYTKSGELLLKVRGTIPSKEAMEVFVRAITKAGTDAEPTTIDYVELNAKRLKAARLKMEEMGRANRQKYESMTPEQRAEYFKSRIPQKAEKPEQEAQKQNVQKSTLYTPKAPAGENTDGKSAPQRKSTLF